MEFTKEISFNEKLTADKVAKINYHGKLLDTNSDKISELEFFLDEFDIDNNEQLAEFLADPDHRDYLLSALGLGIDAEMGSDFEDDEPTPVDYDDIEEFSDKE